jgi:tRNA(Ile)-lysidine synthase
LRDAAAKLAAIIPRERLDAAVLAWAENASRRVRWGVAFSGGADSLALLLLLWAHWPERRGRLRALHFNHRLRGAASGADSRYCRRVCASLGIELIEGSWAGRHRDVSEAEARAARMNFFSQHARVVWFGHQQDDIAETMFMRLARGSGAGGLSAPRPVQVQPRARMHLRALLGIKKSEITRALRTLGVSWREDASNQSGDFFRNRIRRGVIPAWNRAAGRDAIAGAARSRLLLEEDDVALDAWLEEISPMRKGQGGLALAPFAGRPRALLRRALHRWLGAEPRAGEIARPAFDALLEMVASRRPSRQSLGRKGFAVSDGHVLRFESTATYRKAVKIRGYAN